MLIEYTINDYIELYELCNMITIIENGEVKGFKEEFDDMYVR